MYNIIVQATEETACFFHTSHDFPLHIVGVFNTTWLEFKDMAQDPLVSRDPVSASCNRRQDEVLETQTYSLFTNEHTAICPLRWRLSNGLGMYLS
jgi:hypothetical protein